jgi:hypothetical protein
MRGSPPPSPPSAPTTTSFSRTSSQNYEPNRMMIWSAARGALTAEYLKATLGELRVALANDRSGKSVNPLSRRNH